MIHTFRFSSLSSCGASSAKMGVGIMHPACADLFNEKKRILEEGRVTELEKTAAGGKDIATLLSEFFL